MVESKHTYSVAELTIYITYANINLQIEPNKNMGIFNKNSIRFNQQDPLDNGLGDDIAAEQREADSFLDDVSGDDLTRHWNTIAKDIEKDPDWFTFNED